MVLDEIRAKLADIDPNVFYAAVPRRKLHDAWDYIVFRRGKLRKSANGTGVTDVYEVAIVREEYVPDGLAEQVIAAMRDIPGMREAGTDGEFDYMVKPESDDVVEMLVLEFVKPRKRVGDG